MSLLFYYSESQSDKWRVRISERNIRLDVTVKSSRTAAHGCRTCFHRTLGFLWNLLVSLLIFVKASLHSLRQSLSVIITMWRHVVLMKSVHLMVYKHRRVGWNAPAVYKVSIFSCNVYVFTWWLGGVGGEHVISVCYHLGRWLGGRVTRMQAVFGSPTQTLSASECL